MLRSESNNESASVGHANFADQLVARVHDRRVRECSQSRRELVIQDAKELQEFQERRVLSARRAVLDLDRDRNSLLQVW